MINETLLEDGVISTTDAQTKMSSSNQIGHSKEAVFNAGSAPVLSNGHLKSHDSHQLIVPNGNVNHSTQPPSPHTNFLQVPSSRGPSSRPSSALSSAKVSNGSKQEGPTSATERPISEGKPQSVAPVPPSDNVLSLGLREVTDMYRREYLRGLLQIISLNIAVIIIGCMLTATGTSMMYYGAISILNDSDPDDEITDSNGLVTHIDTPVQSLFEKLGSILAGLGTFITMVSITYILDRQAILHRDRLEKIDTYKKNRQQPRNIFEILLANAKQKAAAARAAEREHSDVASVNEPKQASEDIAVSQDVATVIPTASPRPMPLAAETHVAPATSLRPNLESMAKEMANITKQQLKQFTKANDIFAVSQQHQPLAARPSNDAYRPVSRASITSSTRHYQQADGRELPLQVHRIDEWLKTSAVLTKANEFATETEKNNADYDTASISTFSEKDIPLGSPPSPRSITDSPYRNRVHSTTSKGGRRGSALSRNAVDDVFEELIDSQKKTSAKLLYSNETADHHETPLSPPQPPPKQPEATKSNVKQSQQQIASKTLNPLDHSRMKSGGVGPKKPEQPFRPKPNSNLSSPPSMWATNSSGNNPLQGTVDNPPSFMRENTATQMTDVDDKVPPSLPPNNKAGDAAKLSLPRITSSKNGANISNNNVNEKQRKSSVRK